MYQLRSLLVFITASLFFFSCKKQSAEEEPGTCAVLNNIKIACNSPVTIGETIKFGAPEIGGYRIYSWIEPNNFHDQYPHEEISYAELKNEGWYYLALSVSECETKVDSVYIDVKLQQGTPACTVANNTGNYSNLADDSYSSVSKGIDPSFGELALEGSGSYTNLTVLFHPEWRTKEPEDGIYTTINVPSFDPVDYNYNKVYISTVKQSIYWGSYPDQQVYVSHVAGKLQVRFCSLKLGGNNGYSYTTQVSANLVEK